VLDDVLDEYVSVEAARERYGVVVEVRNRRRLDVVVDERATEELRRRLREAAA
jgi:N-methylhydantoinase B